MPLQLCTLTFECASTLYLLLKYSLILYIPGMSWHGRRGGWRDDHENRDRQQHRGYRDGPRGHDRYTDNNDEGQGEAPLHNDRWRNHGYGRPGYGRGRGRNNDNKGKFTVCCTHFEF